MDATHNTSRKPGRIGPWRLLDMVAATMPLRAGMFGGGAAIMPEYGPPDVAARNIDPDELPESNVSMSEQRQAIAREQFRRGRAPGA
jgi:hypothetical protein